MTGAERDELHEAVKEAVAEAMPEALGEILGPMIHSAVRADTRSWRRRATAGFLLLAVGFGFLYFNNRDLSEQNRELATSSTAALCTFRRDIEMRVRASEDFLAGHPKGFPGVPAASIRVSLDGQKRTIAALASLNCPHPK